MRIIFRLLILFGIIGVGIGTYIGLFLLIGFSTYAEIEEFHSFYYTPAILAELEKIRIHTKGRTINVKPNTSSVPYYIKADVSLKVEGMYMKDSDYDYFITELHHITEENITLLVVYSIGRTLGAFYHPTWTAKYDININLTLRTDILYDLHLNVFDTEIFISENLNISELVID